MYDGNESINGGIQIRDEHHISNSGIYNSSVDGESPLEIRFNKGQYA